MRKKIELRNCKSKDKDVRSKISKGAVLSVIMILGLFAVLINPRKADAATKKYSIIIADKSGSYTFYDLNGTTVGKASINVTAAGNIMVPLWSLSKQMPVLSYHYDSKTKKASVVNKVNGKKVVFTKDSKYFYYYSSKTAKGIKKSLPYQMYISKISASVMVHMSALKWVLASTTGCHYYTASDMQKVGYDTQTYSGLIVYNPYKAVSTIPKATVVKGISKTVKVTIPEGYSVPQIFELLVKKGVCASTASLYDAMENYDFDLQRYPLLKELKKNEGRCFKLEGYLFPDTYEFNRLSKPQDAIGKFLRNTEVKISQVDRDKAKSMGYSIDEVLTVASMIEKEIADPLQMPLVASVIYNRLDSNMQLQLDCTTYYLERYIKKNISGNLERYNKYYFTYTNKNTIGCPALPAGPICNPGKAAIQAALNPADKDYLYFYSDADGEYHFSATYVNPDAAE